MSIRVNSLSLADQGESGNGKHPVIKRSFDFAAKPLTLKMTQGLGKIRELANAQIDYRALEKQAEELSRG